MSLFPRRSSAEPLPSLHWDGTCLVGTTTAKLVIVTVPARLVALRRENLPPAAEPALKAAIRFKAERIFSVLGPVAVDAIIAPVRAGQCSVVLLALPMTVLDAIRAAVQLQGRQLAAVRVAELCVPVPVGGVVETCGERSLVAMDETGGLVAVAPLGAVDDERVLQRERLRLGVAADAPACGSLAPQVDFLHPGLNTAQPFFARRGMRAATLAVALATLLVLGLALTVWDALAARSAAHADEDRFAPLATALAAQRTDMKEVAVWFGDRPSMTPVLAALAAALPTVGSGDQVRLVRVRQVPGEDILAEGSAGDRTQMLAFLTRLRQDKRVATAEIRSFRAPSKTSEEVVFELAVRLRTPGMAVVVGGQSGVWGLESGVGRHADASHAFTSWFHGMSDTRGSETPDSRPQTPDVSRSEGASHAAS
jgi:Tfp pilus assembly protein PilN